MIINQYIQESLSSLFYEKLECLSPQSFRGLSLGCYAFLAMNVIKIIKTKKKGTRPNFNQKSSVFKHLQLPTLVAEL